MNISDLISYTALIISIYGAVLSTYVALSEFFRLKVSIFDLSKTCITLTKSNEYLNEYGVITNTYCKDLYTLVIPVRIINKSKNSTTINEITLNKIYKLNSQSSFDNCIPTAFNFDKNFIIAYNANTFDYPIIKPLFELAPLNTIEGYLVFNNINELPNRFDITINAVQKSKTFHLPFNISNDYRNVQIQE